MFGKRKNIAKFCESYRAAHVARSKYHELVEGRRAAALAARKTRVPPFGDCVIDVTKRCGLEQPSGGFIPDQPFAADECERAQVEKALLRGILHIVEHQELGVDLRVHRESSDLGDSTDGIKKHYYEFGVLRLADFYPKVVHVRTHVPREIDVLTEECGATHSRLQNALQLVPSVEAGVGNFATAKEHTKLRTAVEVSEQVAEEEWQPLKDGVNLVHLDIFSLLGAAVEWRFSPRAAAIAATAGGQMGSGHPSPPDPRHQIPRTFARPRCLSCMASFASGLRASWPGLPLLLLAACHPSPRLGPPPAVITQQSTPPATGPAMVFEAAPVPGMPPALPPAPPLAVQEFGPTGAIDVGAEPRVRFNQQVVALGQAMLDEPDVRIVLDPKVEGRTRWRTSELLVFEPKELAPAQRYQVRVVVLRSASDALKRLFAEHPLAFSFETPGPDVEGSYPEKNVQPDDWTSRQAVLLKLTQPTAVAELRKVLSARSLGDKTGPLAVRVEAVSPRELKRLTWASRLLEDEEPLKNRLFQVRPVAPWPTDREIAIEVAAGLVGRLGPVPSTAPWRLTFKTPGPLRIESLRVEEDSCTDNQFVLRLSERISRSQVSRIHISPRPPETEIELTDSWSDDGGRQVAIRGAFVPAQTYTVRIDPQMRDVNGYTVGDGTAGQPWTGTISLAGEPSLQMSDNGIFPVGTPPVFGVTTRWVKTLRVRAAVLDPACAARALFTGGGNKPSRTFESLGVAGKDIVVRDYPLTVKAPTYWSDLAIDLMSLVGEVRGTILVEAAPLALVPAPKDAAPLKMPEVEQRLFRRTDLGPVAFQSLSRWVIKVVRLSDARPVANATVTRLDGSQQVLLGHTDEQGLLVLPWQAEHLPPGKATLVVLDPATHDQALVPPAVPYHAGKHDDKANLLHQGESLLLDITTDRDAYRPEESIALVGFAILDTPFAKSGLRLLPEGTPAVLRVYDINDKTVAEQTLRLDGQGKFWTRLPIAKGARLGGLRVTATIQDATTDAHVKLEDFRTPEFEVTAQPVRDSILIGERAAIRVHANHYSGVPVTFDEVAYASHCHVSPYLVPGLDSGWVAGRACRGMIPHKGYLLQNFWAR